MNEYESELTATFRYVLGRRPGAVIDVGANVGQTLLKLLAIDPSRHYVGVEPQISCCADLQAFIERNELWNHEIICCGISDTTGLATLGFEISNDARASLVPEFRPPGVLPRSSTVPVVTGDELLRTLGIEQVALIKIDVEGGELEVLQSFEETLQKDQPVITLEVLPNELVHSGTPLDTKTKQVRMKRYKAMHELLVGAGYGISLVRQDGSSIPVDSFEPDALGSVRNYVAELTR